MDSDNENQGFEHSHSEQFDFIQLLENPTHKKTQEFVIKKQLNDLIPPISTYIQIKNCTTPSYLNQLYSYTIPNDQIQKNQSKVNKQINNKNTNTNSNHLGNKLRAWCCQEERYLDEQFNENRYKKVYTKFKSEPSYYKFYREYAKNQYKMFVEQDDIQNSSAEEEEAQQQMKKKKSCKLDLFKIQKIMSHTPKQLRFRSNFQSGNLQKVYVRPQVSKDAVSPTESLLRKTSSTLQGSSINSSTNPKSTLSLSSAPILKHYYLILSNDTNTIGFNQWFYFKVFNPNYNKQIKAIFSIVNINKKTINNIAEIGIHKFSQNKMALYGIGWEKHQDGICINYKNNLLKDQNNYYHTLQFQGFIKPRQTIYYALTTPYTFSKLQKFMQRYEENVQIIEKTFCGNPIYIYRTGTENSKKSILITARQHPSQTSSSFIAEGVINKLNKSSLLVNLLKKKYLIVVIPMVNPDGVIHGNSRTNLLGFDVNRKWQSPPNKRHSYQVFNIIEGIMKKIPKVEYLIDLHGHSKKLNSFAYFSTKKSIATIISLQMAERLPWFRVEDCQMATVAPMNTLRWYTATNLSSQKSITVQTSIHGYLDQNKIIRPFSPQNLEIIGQSIIEVLSRIQLQKRTTLKSIKNIKFSQQHQSSDSDPQRDYIKQQKQKQEQQSQKLQLSLPQQLKQIEKKNQQSPRRLRIKTCSTNFYKPFNTTIRQRIKTEYSIQKLNLQLVNPQAQRKINRKKTYDNTNNIIYRHKERNITSIRKLTSNYNQINQLITFTPINFEQKKSPSGDISSLNINSNNIRKQSLSIKSKIEKIEGSILQKNLQKKLKRFNQYNHRYRQKMLTIKTKPK